MKDSQNDVEAQFSEALKNPDTTRDKVTNAGKNLKAATHGVERSMKQNPLGDDIFGKIELDRLFLENILICLIPEIGVNSLNTLRTSVTREKNNKIEGDK